MTPKSISPGKRDKSKITPKVILVPKGQDPNKKISLNLITRVASSVASSKQSTGSLFSSMSPSSRPSSLKSSSSTSSLPNTMDKSLLAPPKKPQTSSQRRLSPKKSINIPRKISPAKRNSPNKEISFHKSISPPINKKKPTTTTSLPSIKTSTSTARNSSSPKNVSSSMHQQEDEQNLDDQQSVIIVNDDDDDHDINDSEAPIWEVEKVLGKKEFKGKTYYKLKWVNSDEITWEVESNCQCEDLIAKYEESCDNGTNDEAENEWEVEKILHKRVRKDKTEYLVKWKGWPGDPTWELEEDCNCVNLIAAYENPKLQKMWNFQGSNLTLWLEQNELIDYMEKFKRNVDYKVAILKFEANYPEKERPLLLHSGFNIGPLVYENHWYLVIIFVNHICITRKILIGDALNTLIGTTLQTHPVYKRLNRMYPNFPIKPVRLTQMDRSDMCGFCTLAAFERATFLYNPNSQFIVENIFYELTRAELIRCRIKPATHGEITVALPIPNGYNNGPSCEFCSQIFDTQSLVDDHINREHIMKPQKEKSKENMHV